MNIEAILAGKGHEVSTVPPDTIIADAMRRMRAERISALVVSEDGVTIAGILSDRGIMNTIADQGIGVVDQSVRVAMTADVFTCSRGDRIGAIMAAMTARRIRHIPVVEEDGKLCGIVSIGDVVKNHLDEIQREANDLREYISAAW